MFVDEIRRGLEAIRVALEGTRPQDVNGRDAASLVDLFAAVERVGAAGKVLYARRVGDTGSFVADGARSEVDWLAGRTGSSIREAKGALVAARTMDSAPALGDAFAKGELSVSQATTIAGVACAGKGAVDQLLGVARESSLSELKAAAQRVARAQRSEGDEARRDAAIHARRFCRTWRGRDGGVGGEFLLTDGDGAAVIAALGAGAQGFFEVARAEGRVERAEQYRADALVQLVTSGRGPARKTGERSRSRRTSSGEEPQSAPVLPRVLLRVDVGALRRGAVGTDERCEIDGVGPVSVATARSLLTDSLLNIVVTDAVDVYAVTSTSRVIPAPVRAALYARDPVCVVPGCDVAFGLEIDHWRKPFALGGLSELTNLARVCKAHHDLHTYRGWHLTGGPGRWGWEAPPSPPSRPPPGHGRLRPRPRSPAKIGS